MRGLGQWASERVSAAEQNLILIVFAVLTVASVFGTFLYMRHKMRPVGQDAAVPARHDPAPTGAAGEPGPHDGRGAGRARAATRRWLYKTDGKGTPRRFFSHREAAWWAVLTTGKVAAPFLLLVFVRAFFAAFDSWAPARFSPDWAIIFTVAALFLVVWPLTAGLLYLYVALSGGVMARLEWERYREDERPRRRYNADG